jgi:hypothetical protein
MANSVIAPAALFGQLGASPVIFYMKDFITHLSRGSKNDSGRLASSPHSLIIVFKGLMPAGIPPGTV